MTGMRFSRTIGIDYSGAETAEASLKGLRVYEATSDGEPAEVLPPVGPKKYWTRRGLAEWLIDTLDVRVPTIIGIDHGFSFPMRYFERHGLHPDWQEFLDDFCAHWPTDGPHTYVDFVRNGSVGNGAARMGERHWRRLTEEATGSAKSVFHFDVQGSVAKSTHSAIPWLRKIRQARPQVHFWPFDGWAPAWSLKPTRGCGVPSMLKMRGRLISKTPMPSRAGFAMRFVAANLIKHSSRRRTKALQ